MLVLAYGRILQKRGSKSWKNQILILVVNLDRKDIKVSFKELRETEKKGHQGKFFLKNILARYCWLMKLHDA